MDQQWRSRFEVEGPVLWRLLALALLLAGILYQSRLLLDHDVGFVLHSASRLLDGAVLYHDIVDPNPPAIFFVSIPPAWVARLVGLPATAVFKAYVVLLILLSLGLSAQALRRILPGLPKVRACLLVAALVLLMPLAGPHFGQREHLFFVAVVPYALSTAAWVMGKPVPRPLAILTGALAGIGVALKPFFLLAWIPVEIYVAAAYGAKSFWRRRENWGIVLVQVAQAAYILVAAPAYYRQVIPMTLEVYGISNAPNELLFLLPATSLCAVALIVQYVIPSSSALSHLRRIAAVVSVGVITAALAQRKGWGYHFYPATASAFLLFALVFLDLVLWIPGMRVRFWRVFLAGMTACVLVLVQRGAPSSSRIVDSLVALIQREAPGEPIVFFSPGEFPAFPTVNYAPARWSFRFSSMWFLSHLYSEVMAHNDHFPYRPPDKMGDTEKFVFDGLVSDWLQTPPRLVMIDCHTRSIGRGDRFDLIQYLSQDPRVAALWRDYKHVSTIDCIDIFKRTGEMALVSGSGC